MSTPLTGTESNARDFAAVLGAQRSTLQARFGVRRIGLFGSVVRGDAGHNSDVDVLVEFEPDQATYDHLFDLRQFLQRLFGRDVDVVTVAGLSPHVRPFVEQDLVWT